MSTYRKLHGRSIQAVTTDPTESVAEGQVWYNTSSDTFKTVLISDGAWRSSAPLLVARDAAGSAGTQTTATIFGGNINPGNTSATDEYNGSGFSSGGTLNTARRQTSGCGLQTAALCVGGYTTANAANVEEYNGTSWSEQNDIPGNYRNGSTFGTQTAALYVGGYSAPVPNSTTIQIYDGTNWTTSPATLGTGGNSISSTGTSTAGLVFGGSNRLNVTEEWNGSAMSTGGTMSTSKYGRGSANQAPSENAMSAGGGIPAQTTVENYNGTSWSTLPSLAVATNSIKGAGTATSAMMMGGGPGAGPVFNTSTEFDKTATITTAAAWASGGDLNTGRNGAGGCGPQTAAMAYGGQQNPGTATKGETEQYDGTSWTEVSDLNTVRYTGGPSIQGTQTATIYFGGARQNPDVAGYNNTETWDGSSWSEVANLNEAREEVGGAGTSTSAVGFGGNPAPATTTTATEEWDGSSWTSVNAMPAADRAFAGAGSQTAALAWGGKGPPSAKTYEYDGTNWTAGGDLITARSRQGCAGTQTAALGYGGDTAPSGYPTATEGYDGTSWSTRPNMASPRQRLTAGSGSQTAALGSGGYSTTTSSVTATEEFTGETETINVKTLTQS